MIKFGKKLLTYNAILHRAASLINLLSNKRERSDGILMHPALMKFF